MSKVIQMEKSCTYHRVLTDNAIFSIISSKTGARRHTRVKMGILVIVKVWCVLKQ